MKGDGKGKCPGRQLRHVARDPEGQESTTHDFKGPQTEKGPVGKRGTE